VSLRWRAANAVSYTGGLMDASGLSPKPSALSTFMAGNKTVTAYPRANRAIRPIYEKWSILNRQASSGCLSFEPWPSPDARPI
jgi:hypothetical protein